MLGPMTSGWRLHKLSRQESGIWAVLLPIAITALLVAALAAQVDPFRIRGGRFEASGVAWVPGTNGVLFVDDGRRKEVFWAELASDGRQRGQAVPISLGADVTDIEGITSDGRSFYVIGSQSKTTGFEGDGLVRFRFDPETRRIGNVERIQGLKAWLAEHVAELRGTANQLGDGVLNIEGLAWDPEGGRLLLGLRAPVVEGFALIIPLRLRAPADPMTVDNLAVDGATIRLDLEGAGIRSIEYDEMSRTYRVIAGAGLGTEDRDFRIVEWHGARGSSGLRELARYSSKLTPEGITRAVIGGRPINVVVFDTGRMALFP
jgi:hypothetical protein